ncbi:hypothetical protein [Rhodohalobacter mucosus]|uniref:Uncharacterized protein n=1 Tax=Rhodohalobacter mucosus TaxID=2079485 RepID=A0A316TX66_9BACT|nr:hypothetical protein [Rhodohalobacter mucosus]PWN08019.1 hypothetical protein DDZ15_03125 [Rhodohalobacter mucosus]
MSDTYKNYLQDLSFLIKERALKANEDLKKASDEEEAFTAGYLAAFHHVIEIMKNQAVSFNIDENEIMLDDFDPDKDLMC